MGSTPQEAARLLGRPPGAIAMRLENFASVDPEIAAHRRGLRNLTPLGKRVYEHWQNKREALHECAEVLMRENRAKATPNLFEPNPIQIPRAFQKYELLDQIGEGGSGIVFSCVDTNTSQVFALKIIRTDRVHDEEALRRFRREIRVLKSLSHKKIITLYEDNLESQRDFPAYVMDFADGSLTSYADRKSNLRREDQMPARREIVLSIIDAVEALHTGSPAVIHRDINPNNVLRLPNGTWVLADFGLAKFISTAPLSTSFRTTTQRGWGTQWYTAPEQYQNFQSTDHRTDIYSVGVLIWEAFTDSHPPPDREHLGLSESLKAVYLKATDRNPEIRYRDIAALRVEFLKAFEETFKLN
ncbi:Serine/threonine-protein kinase PknB [Thalassoglobus neptunius]|uniref:Serine/threonine-protein kinase PknB n=1 Tax=Thalassoglobus neptunius TaxID=1938619 RepID=A0A5C5VQ69_9PLAN|nr:serine/threonine-protein kinase [Thalassoglobus neptunius]TWT39849.1 Serine/threonine-protein kinase PknB [Thalassoglobus neptunius]